MRHYAGSALMLVITTAVIVGSYTVNLKVSAERSEVENLKRSIVADSRRIRDLQAELRTRARLPQMQRWNDEVLQMSAPVAGQYLRSPVQLAGFVVPEAAPDVAVAPAITRAVTPPTVASEPRSAAPIVRAAWRAEPAPAPARVVNAAWRPAAERRPPPPLVIASEPLISTPRDLLAPDDQ
jgi:hypothetical protein